MLIKDPLQIEPTPYDIFKIPSTADTTQIKRALIEAMKTYSSDVVLDAKNTLFNPERRLMVDLLMYPVAKIHALTGDGSTESLPLALDQREKTALNWEQLLKDDFPNDTLLHALAVLYYWWADYESRRHVAILNRLDELGVNVARVTLKDTLLSKLAEAEDCGHTSGAGCPDESCPWYQDCTHTVPTLEALWERAIAYNTVLMTMPKLWVGSYGVDPALGEEVARQLRSRMETNLARLSDNISKTSGTALASQVQDMRLQFETEQLTASLMKDIRITLKQSQKSYNLGSGRFLFREMGQLSTVQGAINAAVAAKKGSQSFQEECQKIQLLLGPYPIIAMLVIRKRWAEALAKLDTLKGSEQQNADVKRLKLEALVWMGLQEFEMGNIESALNHWKKAGQTQGPREIWDKAAPDIEKKVLGYVVKIAKMKPDDAIRILQTVIEMGVKTNALETQLAQIAFRQAIDRANAVIKKKEDGGEKATKAQIAELEACKTLLEIARDHFSPNSDEKRNTEKQLETVRRTLKNWSGDGGGGVGIDPKIVQVFLLQQKAKKAADARNWAEAASYLEEALRIIPSSAPFQLKPKLQEDLKLYRSKIRPPKKPLEIGWIVNGVIVILGLVLLFLNLSVWLALGGSMLIILAVAFINVRPGKGLAWIGAVLAVAAGILTLLP